MLLLFVPRRDPIHLQTGETKEGTLSPRRLFSMGRCTFRFCQIDSKQIWHWWRKTLVAGKCSKMKVVHKSDMKCAEYHFLFYWTMCLYCATEILTARVWLCKPDGCSGLLGKATAFLVSVELLPWSWAVKEQINWLLAVVGLWVGGACVWRIDFALSGPIWCNRPEPNRGETLCLPCPCAHV